MSVPGACGLVMDARPEPQAAILVALGARTQVQRAQISQGVVAQGSLTPAALGARQPIERIVTEGAVLGGVQGIAQAKHVAERGRLYASVRQR